jgi:hypothetical protein
VEAGAQCLMIDAVRSPAIADLNLLDRRFVKQFVNRLGHSILQLF